MKTWEMMQYSSKRFERTLDGLIVEITEDGTLKCKDSCPLINIHDKWEEVKEPMTFMEVVEEVRNNPNIRASLSYKEKGVLTDSLLFDELLQYLGTDFYNATLAEMFLKGEFYIED